MDVVYILGSGSLANDEEILYSARSLCKNMLDMGTVYVVGDSPKHLPGATHFQMQDAYPEGWKNVYTKIIKACSIPELSEEFLLMNDDFFMTEPFEGADFPFYAIKGTNGGSCGQHSFQIHAPMRISKEMFVKMPFDISSNACKSFRSFYANFYGAPPKFIEDCIIQVGENVAPFDEQVEKQKFFSISNSSFLNAKFSDWIKSQFPEGCALEI
jgi:hypothetical protein